MTTSVPAYTFNGFTRPELFFDATGHIILEGEAAEAAALYGIGFLYAGLPANTPWPPVPGLLSVPVDTNAAANSVAEGAAANTPVGLTVSATSTCGLPVTYSLTADSSGGGFKIDAATGVVSVADPTKIDFETSPGHAYSVTVKASDGILTTSHAFTIGVTDVAPSTPTDSNGAPNTVVEGAAVNTLVGITASSIDVNGPGVTWSLSADSSGGGFKIDAATGVVSVADPTKIDFESSPGHAYTVTARASDGTLASSQTFTINVTDVPVSAPIDTNGASNTVAEGAAVNTLVGITASAIDPNGPASTYSLIGDTSGGGFKIDAATGVVSVADPTKIDFETAPGHAYSVTVQANNGAFTSSQTFSIAVTDVAPSTPVDSNAAANTVVEGAANGSTVGVTAFSTDINGPAVTYSLTGDTSGGGFTINSATGVVTVADSTKIDFESAAGHAYTVTAQASDGTLSSSQTFTIAVSDVAPSTPVDSNASANTVAEGAAAGTTVGVTAASTDINGPAVTYSLVGDTSGGGFTINSATGVVTVADPTKIDYESAAGHAYTVTAQASDGTLSSSQAFTIAVSDVAPSAPIDSNAAANTVVEGAANGSTVGVTASSTDVNGPAVTYSLAGDTSGGGFTIDPTTGVVTVADATKIDFESAVGHAYTITTQASDGTLTSSQTFNIIAVTDTAPSTPVDSDAAANTVAEGAANGTTVGITASSTDINGPAVTYSLTGDTSGGGFTINSATGVVTVADSTKVDFESAAGHAYSVTAQASDGTLSSSQTFTIAVTNVAPSTPVDGDAATNTIAEGAANGSTVGVTASSTDVNGPAVTYSLTGDTSGGGFTINAATGVVTVSDPTKIDYETAVGHAYSVTARASDGILTSSQTFTIAVSDVAPSAPTDSDTATNTIAEGAANGSTVGVTASSTDVNGPAVTYSLTGDTSGGGFTINSATGVVTVADFTKIDYETAAGHAYTVTARASDGTLSSSQAFIIAVTDVAPSTPIDSDAAANKVSQSAPVGTYTGVTAASTDINGPAVTWSLTGDTSGGGFTIDSTGKVTVADPTKITYNAGNPTFTVTADASDGTLHSQQTFTITVIPNTPPVANDDSVSATEKGGLNNAVAGVDPSGNVILGTGAAGAVQDTDAQDPSSALTVVAVHTGAEGASVNTGTVGAALTGSHGSLTLNADGSYTYAVNQTDTQVQGLHTAADTLQDVFNYTIQDTGGLQDTATLTVTIHGANDLPQAIADTGTMTEDDAPAQFDVIANDTKDPDSTASNAITIGPGAITVTGPAGETFLNTDAQAAIVGNKVQVTLTNAHFQQLAVGEHATVTVPYTLTGDAGDTSTANLVVTVNGVNDVPVANNDTGSMTEDQVGTFTVLSNDTLDPDHGAPNNVTTGTVTNLVAPLGEGITASDIGLSVNGSNQIVVTLGANFQHMQDGQTTTFDVPYTLHGDQAGDTSTATLHVTVNGVNDVPTVSNVTFNGTSSANYNTDLIVNDPTDGAPTTTGPFKVITASLLSLSNASDVDGPNALTFTPLNNVLTSDGGHVTLQADGDFIYTPKVGTSATSDTFSFTVTDGNTGVAGTATATATITLQGPHIWYVDASAAAGGDGSSEHPFNSLAPLNGVGNNGATTGDVDNPGDIIYLEGGTYSGGITLENNEQLISRSNGLVVADGGGGAGTVTLDAASGANAVVDGGVVLASGNNIQGVDFGTTAGFAVSGSSVGTVHINDTKSGVINNASGGGISIGGSSNVLNVDFTSVTSGGGTNGIALTNSSGTFHSHGGTISGASGADVALNGGSVAFTDDGAISDATGTVVSIANMTGGTQSFTGAIGTTGSTDGSISLSSNSGATINFSGGMALSTGSSNAFSATGGGTVTVTGTNHLTTGTGTALNISGTTIGSGNVTFHDISSSGAASGIILNNTGTSGGLKVTGNGTGARDGSGGTIQNTTGDGVSLTSTSQVSLTHMNINNTAGNGVFGSAVNGFVSDWNSFSSNGNATKEGAIRFGFETDPNSTGLTGGAIGSATETRIDNTLISGSFERGVSIFNNSGTLTQLNVHGTTIQNSAHGSGMLLELRGNAIATADLQNSTFTGNAATGFTGSGTAQSTLTVNAIGAGGHSNTFSNNNDGIWVLSAGDAHVTTEISNNTMSGNSPGAAITVSTFASSTASGSLSAKILNNNVTVPASGLNDGIQALMSGTGTVSHVKIDGNTVNDSGTGANGIFVGTPDNNTTPNYTAIITNNTVTMNNHVNSGNGIEVSASRGTGVFKIEHNTVTGAGIDGIVLFRFSPGTASLEQGVDSTLTQASTVLHDNNPGAVAGPAAGTLATEVAGTVTVVPNGTITLPMNAASGGVAAATPAQAASTGNYHLTQSQLDSVVAAAIAQWEAAGASASQLAALHATTFSVADLSGNTIGEEGSPSHITIDINAAGHGWFVDPTPADNSEFTHAQNAAGTDLLTDPTTAAAGHLDLLTAVSHELGHVIGLDDSTAPGDINDLMYISLVDGERRLPGAADVAQANAIEAKANASLAKVIEAALPSSAQAHGGAPIVVGTAGNDTIDAGYGGKILFGGAGADNFVFGPNIHLSTPADPVAQPLTHVADYSAVQGDTFDFSALTSSFHASGVSDASLVRAVEDPSGTFATLQLNTTPGSGTIGPSPQPGAANWQAVANWVNVAQIDGAHAGDAVNVLVDSHAAIHLAQIHVDVLV